MRNINQGKGFGFASGSGFNDFVDPDLESGSRGKSNFQLIFFSFSELKGKK
jgi:hypothetical protein